MSRRDHCFECGDLVIGLIGQDAVLDTFYLQADEEGHRILEEGAFGEVHLVCLIHSVWGSFWAARMAANMRDVRGLSVQFESDRLVLFRNDALNETIAIRHDGWYGYLRDDAVGAGHETQGGILLSVTRELNLRLSDYPQVYDELDASLSHGTAYPLLDLVTRLELRKRLFSVDALDDGRLEPFPAYEGDEALGTNDTGFVASIGVYHQFVPEEIIRPLLDAGADHPPLTKPSGD